MAELISPAMLAWRHLPQLEDPFFVRSQVEAAANHHQAGVQSYNRHSVSNFSDWLRQSGVSTEELSQYVLRSLEQGEVFYVHTINEKPIRPLVFWQESEETQASDSFYGYNGHWQVYSYVKPAIRNKLQFLLQTLRPPKPVVVRKAASSAVQKNPAAQPKVKERHQFVVNIEAAKGCELPAEVPVTLVVLNTNKERVPVKQINDLIWNSESRVFRAEQGDSFEAFVIRERQKDVRKDLNDNKNLKASVAADLIAPLSISNTYTRNDDVIVHEVTYEVPNHYLEIELVDEDDIPEAFARYQVFDLNDELYAEGELDDQGRARVEGIDELEAQVFFPGFDGAGVMTEQEAQQA